MSFADFAADRKAFSQRAEWWIVFQITDPNGSLITLRFSKRGTRPGDLITTPEGETIAANNRFDKRIKVVPTITSSMWKDGNLLSNSLPTYGPVVFQNADRYFDQYHPRLGYVWAGNFIKVLCFDYINPASTIKRIFKGQIGNPQIGLNGEVTLPVFGYEEKFNRPTHSRIYRGTSYAVEFFGDKTASFGTPAACNITGDLTLEGWFWIEGLPTTTRRTWGWGSGATFPWSLGFQSTGEVIVAGTISGGVQSRASVAKLSILRFYHIACKITGRDVKFLVWDDEARTLTTETYANVFTSSTRQTFTTGGAGTGYLLKTDSDATFKPWFDELRVWNYARTDDEIAADRFRPLNTSIPATCVHRLGCDEGVASSLTDSSATAAHGTITGAGTHTYLWVMEGGPELAGTPKPDTIGQKFGVRPILVDPIRNCYQVHWGSIASVQSSEGGNPHTMAATAASFRAFVTAAAPASGNALPYLAKGLFKLPATAPVLPIAAIVTGANDSALGSVTTSSKVAKYLGLRAGLVDPTDFDSASITTFESGFNPVVGFTSYESRSSTSEKSQSGLIRDYLDLTLRSAGGWWGSLRGATVMSLSHFTTPSGSAVRALDQRVIIDIQDVSPETVIYEVEVRYHYNDVVMTEDQVASAIKGTTNWTQWTRPYLFKLATDSTLKATYEGKSGKRLVLETAIYNDSDAQALANNVLPIVKGIKTIYRVSLFPVALDAVIGETESIAYSLQTGVIVLGLTGNNGLILTTVDQNQTGKLVHDLMLT